MMQNDLFPVATRNNCPESSFVAEHKITKSGKRKSDYDLVISGLRKYPNSTGAELAYRLNVEVYTVRRRLSDAKSKGDAKITKQRVCQVAGTLASEWHIL